MIETDQKSSHEFLYHNGIKHIRCLVCGTTSPNQLYIDSLYCARCGVYHPQNKPNNFKSKDEIAKSNSNSGIPNSGTVSNGSNANTNPNNSDNRPVDPKPVNLIYCDKCLQPMKQTYENSKYFICPSGHQVFMANLIQVDEKPKKNKRKIEHHCKFCGEVAEIVSESKWGANKKYRKYSCGHSEFIDLLAPPDGRDSLWTKAFPFQQKGIEFLEESNYTALLADEMGLGKTMQSLMALRYNYSELTPTLIVCEAAKVYDWEQEFKDWVLRDNPREMHPIKDFPVIHQSGQYGLVPGWNIHIISMAKLMKPKVLKSILEYGFKMAIIDESHSFKNEDSNRTAALQKICKVVPHYVFLSGTPVMNRVEEFFTTLNILRPSHFPSKASLLNKCDRTPSGKILGISPYYRDRFFKMISGYVLRRNKKEVGIQLPELFIHSKFIPIEDNKDYIDSYNKQLDELENLLNSKKANMGSSLLAIFTNLRHIAGLMKVKSIAAFAREFLENTENDEKLTIGVHHVLVRQFLCKELAEFNPISVSDEDGLIKTNKINEFKKPENRLMIVSVMGAGQGLNLQFCKNFILGERQWNQAREDQFSQRFQRIARDEQGEAIQEYTEDDKVIGDILNAKDTLDEYFDAAVKLKAQIVKTTQDHDFSADTEFMRELAEQMVKTRIQHGIG